MVEVKPPVVETPVADSLARLSRPVLVATLLLAFALRLAWAWLIPYDKAPDEGLAHIHAIQFYLDHFRLPTRPEILSNEAGAYGGMSPLPYVLHWFFGLFAARGVPLEQQILIPRLGSVVAGTAVIWAASHGCRKLFPRTALLQWGIPLLLAVQPQLVFISAYLNSDIFSVLVATLLIASWPDLLQSGLTWRRALYLGLLGGLLALCKLNALALVPSTLLVLGMTLYRHRLPWRTVAVRGLAASGLALALSAWLYVRNYLVLGDMMGYKSMWEVAKLYLGKIPAPIERGMTMKQALVDMPWRQQTFQSSWGVYGYMNVFQSETVYSVLSVFCILGILSVAWLLIRRRAVENLTPGLMVCILIGFVLSVGLMAWTSYFNDWQPQGRYHFPVVFGEATLLFVGWTSLARSPKWKHGIGIGMIVITLGLTLYNYFFLLWPLYR